MILGPGSYLFGDALRVVSPAEARTAASVWLAGERTSHRMGSAGERDPLDVEDALAEWHAAGLISSAGPRMASRTRPMLAPVAERVELSFVSPEARRDWQRRQGRRWSS